MRKNYESKNVYTMSPLEWVNFTLMQEVIDLTDGESPDSADGYVEHGLTESEAKAILDEAIVMYGEER